MGRKKKKNKSNKEGEIEADDVPRKNLHSDAKRSLAAVALFALAILSVLGFFGSAGAFGEFLNKVIAIMIGWVKFIFPIFLVISGIVLLLRKETSFYVTKLIGLFIALLSLTGIFHWFVDFEKMLPAAASGQGGGYIGYVLEYNLEKYLGSAGGLVVLLALVFLGIILAFNFSIIHLFLKSKEGKEKEIENEQAKEAEKMEKSGVAEAPLAQPEPSVSVLPMSAESKEEREAEKNIGRIEFVEGRDQYVAPGIGTANFESDFQGKKLFNSKAIGSGSLEEKRNRSKKDKNPKWILPPDDMLERSYGTAKGGDIESNFVIIQKTLENFGIKVERGGVKTGPSVTQYSFRPAVGVKISKIISLQNDLSLALAAHPIRIEAPIPGRSLIGIEIPNKTSLVVRLRDMIEEDRFKKRNNNLTLALGQDVSGECMFGDLGRMPHLMIAGATGTGKSVCINSIITTLLYQNSPEDLKFIMIDPKRVELSLYNGIPHLLTNNVVVENSKVVNTLKWAVGEMERRYRLFQDTDSRDLSSYREKLRAGKKIKHTDSETGEINEEELKKLPYIVIVIDELADIMGSYGKEVEGAIVRIAQMARAVGIHLIVSTQRPSVEVITGLIKANITTRIAFQVATQIDSRTILDMGGAEKLLGSGDMLYLSSSSPKPKRIQGVFVSESEVKRVVKFIKDQKKKDEDEEEEKENITENIRGNIAEFKTIDARDSDNELFRAAKDEIMRSKKASASFLQRRLRIGYARAARLLDILEEEGIVGPADGAKPREIYGLSDKQEVRYEEPVADQAKRDKWQI